MGSGLERSFFREGFREGFIACKEREEGRVDGAEDQSSPRGAGGDCGEEGEEVGSCFFFFFFFF